MFNSQHNTQLIIYKNFRKIEAKKINNRNGILNYNKQFIMFRKYMKKFIEINVIQNN